MTPAAHPRRQTNPTREADGPSKKDSGGHAVHEGLPVNLRAGAAE